MTTTTNTAPMQCPNCGSAVDAASPGCVLHDLIQVVRERGELSEQRLREIHASVDADLLWQSLGVICDNLEGGVYDAASPKVRLAPTIKFASQELVDEYTPEIERILEVIEHPEALVTDESRLADFYVYDGTIVTEQEEQRRFESHMSALGLSGAVTMPMLLVNVAALLRTNGGFDHEHRGS